MTYDYIEELTFNDDQPWLASKARNGKKQIRKDETKENNIEGKINNKTT